MTRKTAREIVLKFCFEITITGKDANEIIEDVFDNEYYESLKNEDEVFNQYPDDKQMEYIKRMVRGIGEHNVELDGYVEKYSKGWQFHRISRIAVAIMKTAMYEILYMPDIPNGASINEAVELARAYEEPETVPFINGVLGSFTRGELNQ
ncbi:MAG: transcription antitermination factor NusB [Ruminococcaceae bacterium]|nr:transcription antitermination factor NusB [Oscillospiraceae bacterium]